MKISDSAKRNLEQVGIRITGSRWAWTVVVGTMALWANTAHSPARGGPPTPNPATPPSWTADTRLPLEVIGDLSGALPEPIKGQYRPPCEPEIEREIKGACWVPIDAKPCPVKTGKVWEHTDGKCYARAMRLPREPTTGELLGPGGVASPGEP